MNDDTPPWQLGPADLSSDLDKVRQQWTAVREILGDVGLYELRAPSVSAWSCGEHAGHVLLAAKSMAHQIHGNLADPEASRERAPADFAQRVLEAGTFPRGRGKAPQHLQPVGASLDEWLDLMPAVVDAWESIASREQEVRSCPARSEHFAFGYLTSVEWVRMCAIHTAHHLAIVRDVRG